MNTLPEHSCNVLVTDSGAAGLSLALHLANQHQVIVLGKGPVTEGSTSYVQDGIAAVSDKTDSIDSHVEDTLIVKAGICDRHAVEFIASNARPHVQWLIDQEVLFDTHIQPSGEGSYHLTRKDEHSHRRILHAVDATGREVKAMLVGKAQDHPNIHVPECGNAVDLIVSDKIDLPGARWVADTWVWNRNKETAKTCHAKTVVLATGGASKVYQYTTNPDISSGSDTAMTWCTGCRVANLEFSQSHPTALYHPQTRNFPLTEALRGEGTCLRRPDGTRFIPDLDERGELAPCDIVTRAIGHEIKRLGVDCIFLDISHKPADFIHQHFPMIYEKLLGLGIGLAKEPVPIVPVVHCTCGDVMVDDHGRTGVDSLYTIDEVGYVGLHDANRTASNSLLECLVYGWSVAEDISRRIPCAHGVNTLPPWGESRIENPDKRAITQHNQHELRLFMWNYVSIVRTTRRLARAPRRIAMLRQEIDEYYTHFCVSNNLLELRNLVQVAELIVRCAMMRKESRGLHFTLSYPELLTRSGPSILSTSNHYINR